MYTKYYQEYSHTLQREMEFQVYGHAGKPCIVFPAQDGNYYDFENFGMVDTVKEEIEAGKLQLFCIQSVDKDSWSAFWDQHTRIMHHETWFSYVCEELLPRLRSLHNQTAHENYQGKFMTTGCSMGAYHAVNFLLRRPDLFDSVIALSGLFHASYFFPNYNDEVIYMNSPVDNLPNMEITHPHAEALRKCQIIICCGQGNWEDEAKVDARILDEQFKRLNIPAWIDLWGNDVDHDWPWWKIQFPYFIKKVL